MSRFGYWGRGDHCFHLMTILEANETVHRSAFHEPGHAVVAMALGLRVTRIVANLDDPHARIPETASASRTARVAICVAGYLSERRKFPENRAWTLRSARVDVERVRRHIEAAPEARAGVRLAARLLREHWDIVERLAARALDPTRIYRRGHLTESQIQRACGKRFATRRKETSSWV